MCGKCSGAAPSRAPRIFMGPSARARDSRTQGFTTNGRTDASPRDTGVTAPVGASGRGCDRVRRGGMGRPAGLARMAGRSRAALRNRPGPPGRRGGSRRPRRSWPGWRGAGRRASPSVCCGRRWHESGAGSIRRSPRSTVSRRAEPGAALIERSRGMLELERDRARPAEEALLRALSLDPKLAEAAAIWSTCTRSSRVGASSRSSSGRWRRPVR